MTKPRSTVLYYGDAGHHYPHRFHPMANILCFLIATSTFAAIVAEFGNVAPPVVYHQLDK
jgi:hypothetical protein